MEYVIVIPARYQSSRFPGKPLAPLRGAEGEPKTLIARCVQAALAIPGAARVIVATDDQRIAAEAEAHGGEAVMTSASCRNGTERIAEAITKLGIDHDIVVNIQGDAPLTPPWFVEALVAAFAADDTLDVATPVVPFEPGLLEQMRLDAFAGKKGATASVFTPDGTALYFSKQVIPFCEPGQGTPVFQHLGLYAYRPAAVAAYAAAGPTPLEMTETLEQLRFLEIGRRIKVVEVDPRGRIPWEVNYPEDVPIVEQQLAALGIR